MNRVTLKLIKAKEETKIKATKINSEVTLISLNESVRITKAQPAIIDIINEFKSAIFFGEFIIIIY